MSNTGVGADYTVARLSRRSERADAESQVAETNLVSILCSRPCNDGANHALATAYW